MNIYEIEILTNQNISMTFFIQKSNKKLAINAIKHEALKAHGIKECTIENIKTHTGFIVK